jgi:hypothetical protein
MPHLISLGTLQDAEIAAAYHRALEVLASGRKAWVYRRMQEP